MAPMEAVDAVMVLIDKLEEVLVDLQRLAKHMKEDTGDDDTDD